MVIILAFDCVRKRPSYKYNLVHYMQQMKT